ncbi:MAG: helix-turn-helix domain-containing protein [Chloroflexi bacterium]|nr:helix-turn-helix domain-containing protein [Chloroflexota bacterium]MBU1750424.1 helix-turn-helix domain-containing protein [Chloroflexota bacterium]
MEVEVTFGSWVRRLRLERGLDLQDLAERAGVDISTISRIENERTQATISTTLGICQGLGVEPIELVRMLRGGKLREDLESEQDVTSKPKALTANDIQAFLGFFRYTPQRGPGLLADWINLIGNARVMRSNKRARPEAGRKRVMPDDIYYVVTERSVSESFDFLNHRPEMTADLILELYKHGGILTVPEVGVYIRERRREKGATLVELEKSTRVSDSVLSRLESGSIERIKLSEIVAIDKVLGQGEILAMCFGAIQSRGQIPGRRIKGKPDVAYSDDRERREDNITDNLVLICRWLHCLFWDNTFWLEELRDLMNPECTVEESYS